MDWREEEALWRYSLIRDPSDARLSGAERGALVRALALRLHAHPSGDLRSVGRTTLDDWIRAYRLGGFGALAPKERASVPLTPRALLDQVAALRRENPARTGAQIARIVRAANGGRGPSERRWSAIWLGWACRARSLAGSGDRSGVLRPSGRTSCGSLTACTAR
jgi:putative transposase